MSAPAVSVLIATHNYGLYVPAAVESVLAQDYDGPLECIVVDDGSTDDTPRRLAPFRDRIRCVRQENAGQSAAFNAAFRLSRGAVICFLDADDRWEPAKVSRVVAALDRHPGAGLVHHKLRIAGPHGEIVDRYGAPSLTVRHHPAVRPIAHGDVRRWLLDRNLQWCFGTTSAAALPRWMCDRLFPLPEGIRAYADNFIFYGASLLAPVCYIDEVLGRYLVHGGNTTALRRSRAEQARAEMATFTQVAGYLNRLLEREGRRERITASGTWTIVKRRAIAAARPPADFALAGIGAALSQRGAPAPIRIRRALKILARTCESSLVPRQRRRFLGAASQPVPKDAGLSDPPIALIGDSPWPAADQPLDVPR
jgi:glycosyltransferase involved in cell wall biosynthesis